MIEDTQPTDAQTMKSFIRELARKNRVAQKNKDAISLEICRKFTALPAYAAAKTVMWYVDAGSEVRTRHTLPEALTHGKRVIVPWCIVETNELELFWLEDMSELVEGAYKILEPKAELRDLPAKKVQPEDLDLVMVPGTAFDQRGGRMGQGKGYYDRLLSRARLDAPLVALSFDCQIFEEIPVAAHDVFMDQVLTESRTIVGKGRAGK
ncbi:5-formyltetrahydrofolate cyclo-ligase family protein [Gemmata sp. SH-PL17]|uniref:5-formyltetrahydrofolate cyclo-ligase n=1 Tax=Gemmata sp. SH-PL17 TaxID=1630693 RepID=UPI0004B713CA|nr:5-formyltetrahydrofolate cyclo-ligase [Gemmata sp. SH-PL17]AMV27128.1 5-formyltetrahydrofolate cyclo-ligase family protein [Gemmata sp. SH-PL17]